MLEIANEILLKMKLKEHFEGKHTKYILTKEQLIDFAIKYNKTMEKVKKEIEKNERNEGNGL